MMPVVPTRLLAEPLAELPLATGVSLPEATGAVTGAVTGALIGAETELPEVTGAATSLPEATAFPFSTPPTRGATTTGDSFDTVPTVAPLAMLSGSLLMLWRLLALHSLVVERLVVEGLPVERLVLEFELLDEFESCEVLAVAGPVAPMAMAAAAAIPATPKTVFFVNVFMMMHCSFESADRRFPGLTGDPVASSNPMGSIVPTRLLAVVFDFLL
jgi:hypothetical protein